jgi:hypothetical protein
MDNTDAKRLTNNPMKLHTWQKPNVDRIARLLDTGSKCVADTSGTGAADDLALAIARGILGFLQTKKKNS